MPKALVSGKPNQQVELLTFLITAVMEQSDDVQPQYKQIVKSIAACLGDRNKDVRGGANELLVTLARAIGPDKLTRMCTSLDASTKSTALEVISKVQRSGGSSSAPTVRKANPSQKTSGLRRPSTAVKTDKKRPTGVRPSTAGAKGSRLPTRGAPSKDIVREVTVGESGTAPLPWCVTSLLRPPKFH
jgi:hypothetical protein